MRLFKRLFKKRTVWLPTWPALLAGMVSFVLLFGFAFFGSHDFLAVHQPARGSKLLVVEAWLADASLERVAGLMTAEGSPYESVWLAGPALERGSFLEADYGTFAEVGAATLVALGVPREQVHAAPAAADLRHRTYHAAVEVREAIAAASPGGRPPAVFDLATQDVHARRSRLVYGKVFPGSEIGVVNLPPTGYDADGWYRSSSGMKNTVFEIVAYLYEKLGDGGR